MQPTHRLVLLNRLIFILSVLGMLIALYVVQSFLRQAPIVCLNTGCELVRKHPASYLFGIPVPAFGLVGYSLLSVLTFLRSTGQRPALLQGIAGVAGFGVLFVSWFTYTELTVIKAFCTWCAVSAGIMGLIFVLSSVSLLEERKIHATHN